MYGFFSAAHCTEAGLTFVKVGMLNRSECNFNTATYRVKSIIVHPNFDSLRTNEDIALIQLQRNIKFNEHIYPICLPTKQDDYQKAIVTGFGNLGDGTYSERLMKVVVEKFDHNECSDLYVSRPIFKDTMLCYGDKRKSRDSCDVIIDNFISFRNVKASFCIFRVTQGVHYKFQTMKLESAPILKLEL